VLSDAEKIVVAALLKAQAADEALSKQMIACAHPRDDQKAFELARDRRQGAGMAFAMEWYMARPLVIEILKRAIAD